MNNYYTQAKAMSHLHIVILEKWNPIKYCFLFHYWTTDDMGHIHTIKKKWPDKTIAASAKTEEYIIINLYTVIVQIISKTPYFTNGNVIRKYKTNAVCYLLHSILPFAVTLLRNKVLYLQGHHNHLGKICILMLVISNTRTWRLKYRKSRGSLTMV